MDMEEESVIKRAEVDTRAPFRSVREAISLFGNRVLDGKIHRGALDVVARDTAGDMREELKETRQSLQRAREECRLMEGHLSSLTEELDRTKQELHRLKLMEESPKHISTAKKEEDDDNDDDKVDKLQKKRYVTFVNSPTVLLQQQYRQPQKKPSSNKTKKLQPVIPLIGGIFSKKKKTSPEVTPSVLVTTSSTPINEL
ncbi:hypothetical protein SAY87_031097 [Trapa incisa]|uniref:WEB family protein n=1 Tax=Trapa incisa TaxID=236973 RepID=A0AAN7KPI1_9MYRT|nr:hypothetical protein SAY87_031097 [Trapa incisa]